MNPPNRSSIQQVAERAGVSQMTISNVLRGRTGKVSPQTMERVLAAVRELEYSPVPPPTFQSRRVETRTIGLFYDQVKLDEYWGLKVSSGLHEGAIEHDYDLLTMLRARNGEAVGKDELRFLNRRSDAFIFMAPAGRSGVLGTLVQQQVPVVTTFTDEGVENVSSVVVDNEDALKLSVRHVVEAGHQNIAFLVSGMYRSDFSARYRGFESAIQNANCHPLVFDNVDLSMPGWAEDILSLVAAQKISALVCASDYIALEFMRLAQERGMQAPRDFSIVGMDDIPLSAQKELTTIQYSSEEIGRRAIEAAVLRLAGKEASQCNFVVPVALKIRKSVAAPKKS